MRPGEEGVKKKIAKILGCWLVRWVRHGTLDLQVVSLSPTLGIEISLKRKKKRKKMLRFW